MRPAYLAAASALCVSIALLAACDRPKPRAIQAENAPRMTDSLPAAPEWAAAYMGQGLRELFPERGDCVGNTDAVEMRYEGASPGTKFNGWAWDEAAAAPVERIVLVDRDSRIVGAGESGLPRPDVPAARPDITSGETGWSATTALTSGAVDAYGITNAGRGACPLGHIEF